MPQLQVEQKTPRIWSVSTITIKKGQCPVHPINEAIYV